MKKKIISMILTGSVLLSLAACKSQPARALDETVSDQETEQTTVSVIESTSEDITDETVFIRNTFLPVNTEDEDPLIHFDPLTSATRLFPIYVMIGKNSPVYTFDPGFYNDAVYRMGFVDINGEIAGDPDFSYVRYFEYNDSYIAVKKGEFGITSCGFISADGTKCTGFDFNGFYVDYDGVAYLSKYEKGKMTISCYDKDLNVVFENKEINVDANIASIFHDGKGVCVRAVYDNTTLIGKMDILHSTYNCLIENESGKVIKSVDRFYGDVLVDNGNMSISVFDKDGNEILDGYKSFEYLDGNGILLINDIEVISIDKEGNIINKVDLKEGYTISLSDNFVVINNDYKTHIYDDQLNLISKCLDVHLESGLLFEIVKGDPSSIVFTSFVGGFVENINTGKKISFDLNNSDWTVNTKSNYLYVDNSNDPNATEEIIGYFDKDLNKIDVPNGKGYSSKDLVTGEVYVSYYDEETNKSIVYNVTTGEKYCELENKLYEYFIVYDGVLCGLTGNNMISVQNIHHNVTNVFNSVLVGKDGNLMVSYDVITE